MTEPQKKDDNVSRETLTPDQLKEIIANDPPALLNPKDYPSLSLTRRGILAWQVHLYVNYDAVPITTICEFAGCSRSTYYECQADDVYLGHLVLLCRRAIGSAAPQVTRAFIKSALAGDTKAQDRIMQITGVAPVDKQHVITESIGDGDGDLNEDEQRTIAQGFDRFLSEDSKQSSQKKESPSVAGSSETSDSQESKT